MLFALQTKFDYIAHKIADDCTSLCSARFTTTTHKTDSSLSLVLFMVCIGKVECILFTVVTIILVNKGEYNFPKGKERNEDNINSNFTTTH